MPIVAIDLPLQHNVHIAIQEINWSRTDIREQTILHEIIPISHYF